MPQKQRGRRNHRNLKSEEKDGFKGQGDTPTSPCDTRSNVEGLAREPLRVFRWLRDTLSFAEGLGAIGYQLGEDAFSKLPT
jgi:hypothetical protein